MWKRLVSPRPDKRAAGGLLGIQPRTKAKIVASSAVAATLKQQPGAPVAATNPSSTVMDDSALEELIVDKDGNTSKMFVPPPRYRFRDLIMGDFAFNDDGER